MDVVMLIDERRRIKEIDGRDGKIYANISASGALAESRS